MRERWWGESFVRGAGRRWKKWQWKPLRWLRMRCWCLGLLLVSVVVDAMSGMLYGGVYQSEGD